MNPIRPTYLEVSLQRLKTNLENIRAHVAPAKVMQMVKANAYGHGVDGVAPFIEPYVDAKLGSGNRSSWQVGFSSSSYPCSFNMT
jgi:hypothetical protein